MTLPRDVPPEWFDQDVPLVIVKAGRYPTHHGGLYLARSAGRAGLDVWAMVENRLTPLATSRYVHRQLPPLELDTSTRELVGIFAEVADQAGCRPVLACSDDEAAILINESAHELQPYARIPDLAPGKSRWLVSKSQMNEACEQAGVAFPRTASSDDAEALSQFMEQAVFPVAAKNQDAFSRRDRPGVEGTVVLENARQLAALLGDIAGRAPVILQEYVPERARVNCIYQGYRSSSDDIISFTGVKLRDYPVGRGETTLAEGFHDERLQAWGDRLLRELDYRGVCGLDVLLDRRDDTYKLIDFNTRFGANCATLQADNGIDLVRAYHLDLTGRPVPQGRQIDGVVFQVEPNDAKSLEGGHSYVQRRKPTVYAYRAWDDPVPAAMATARLGFRGVRNRVRGLSK